MECSFMDNLKLKLHSMSCLNSLLVLVFGVFFFGLVLTCFYRTLIREESNINFASWCCGAHRLACNSQLCLIKRFNHTLEELEEATISLENGNLTIQVWLDYII